MTTTTGRSRRRISAISRARYSPWRTAEEVRQARAYLESSDKLHASWETLLHTLAQRLGWTDTQQPAAPAPVAPPAAVTTIPGARRAAPPISEHSRASAIGPGFDCAKAMRPLARLICADPELSKTDLRFNQAYEALRQQLGTSSRQQLQQDDLEYLDSVRRLCGVPDTGEVAGSPSCVGAQYDRKREEWTSRLSGPAREEATRPIERHVALQADLQRLGFLPTTAKIDGVYSAAMRAAIVAWQNASGAGRRRGSSARAMPLCLPARRYSNLRGSPHRHRSRVLRYSRAPKRRKTSGARPRRCRRASPSAASPSCAPSR